jgi:hypothetical protein
MPLVLPKAPKDITDFDVLAGRAGFPDFDGAAD